jgi:hypothetical protein
MGKIQPVFLNFFHEELGYPVSYGKETLGYQVYYVDFSSWKLRLTSATPVIWIQRTDLEENKPQHILQGLEDVVRERNLNRQIVLVLVDGDALSFYQHPFHPTYNLVVINLEDQKRIIKSRRPSGELLDLISAQVPISNLSPY